MSDYALQAARGAELRTKDVAASTARYRDACHIAAATGDGYAEIRKAAIQALRTELTEGGAKGQATKVATVALCLRAGGQGLAHHHLDSLDRVVVCACDDRLGQRPDGVRVGEWWTISRRGTSRR